KLWYKYYKRGIAVMGGKKFTDEEIKILESNPFTLTVSESQIRFTVEFKRFLLEEREINGTPWKEIFRKAGYDPEMLGARRMQRASENIRKEVLSAKGLHESSSKKHISKGNERVQTRKAIQQLQDEVLRLQQQIEFLKKTQMLKVLEENEEKHVTD
ncbi:MAG: hypothetical protein IKT31_03000, partial [Firmicutes bacterium]|nr:hypothetical protein [Bacillota bacterium]